MQILKCILLLSIVSLGEQFCLAGTVSGIMQVTATVNPTCQLTVTNLSFGTFVPTSSAATSAVNTSISSICTKTTAYTMSLSSGSGSMTARTMIGNKSGNSDKINYTLYSDSALTKIFGDGSLGTYNVSGTGNGAQINIPIYGKLLTNQFSTPDNYSDNIVILITY